MTPIKWIKQKFATTIRYVTVRIGTGSLQWPITDEFKVGQAGKKDVNLATALRLIPDSIAGLPILVEEETVVNGTDTWQADADNSLNDLIQEPTPYHDKSDWVKHIIQSLILLGNSYFFSFDDKELWPIPVGMMAPAIRKGTGLPFGYFWDPHGPNKKFYKSEEIFHIKLYDANSPFIGTPPTISAIEQMRSNKYAVNVNKNFFKNGATPGILFEGDGVVSDDEKKLLSEWNAKHKGDENAFKAGLLPSGYKANVVTPSIKDMMFGDGIRLNREQLYGLIGIPPYVGGVLEFANYANALIQSQTYWENTLIPYIKLIQSVFKRQVIKRYFEDNLRIRFDLSGVQALKTDSLKQAQTDQIYVNTGILTVNEVRAREGLEPVEWGDEPPPRGFQQPTTATNTIMDRFQAAHDRVENEIDKFAPGYEKLMNRYFKEQGKRVVENVNKATSAGLVMSNLEHVVRNMVTGDDIFDRDEENKLLAEKIKPVDTKVIGQAGQSAINDMGIDATFNLRNPLVQAEVSKIVNRSLLINDTTFEDIRLLLQQAVKDGTGSVALAKEIKELYKSYTTARSKMIARTEMGAVVNGGSFSAYEQENISREWLTFFDSATRPGHQAANSQIVEPGQPFIVGGEALRYPLDPNASAGNRINCRCAVAPVIIKKE